MQELKKNIGTYRKCKTRVNSRKLKSGIELARPRLASAENFWSEKWGWNDKNEALGPIYRRCTSWEGQRTLRGQHVSVDLWPKKKKKGRESKRIFSNKLRWLSLIQVRLILTHEQCSFRTQFRGNKMRNYVIYPTPLVTIEMSNKDRTAIDTAFCPPLIYVLDS